jgi:hypothetical protein
MWGFAEVNSTLDGCELSTSPPCYFSLEKEPRYSLNKKPFQFQNQSGRFGEDKSNFLLPESDPDHPPHGLITILPTLC